MGGLANAFAQYIDFFFQPMVVDLPCYIRDSVYLLDILKKVQMERRILVAVTGCLLLIYVH